MTKADIIRTYRNILPNKTGGNENDEHRQNQW